MDKHLTWKYHTTELCKKLSRTAGIFFKVRHYVPLPTLICLYNSLFSYFLNYGISAWVLTYETYFNLLFRLQKKIRQAIKFQPFSAPSSPIFPSLKILKLQDVLHTNNLTFVYEAFNKLSPYFHDYFQPNATVHRIGTRQATRGDPFSALKNTTLYGLQTIQYFDSKLWNTLPIYIRVATSVAAFRSKLNSYFIDSYTTS